MSHQAHSEDTQRRSRIRSQKHRSENVGSYFWSIRQDLDVRKSTFQQERNMGQAADERRAQLCARLPWDNFPDSYTGKRAARFLNSRKRNTVSLNNRLHSLGRYFKTKCGANLEIAWRHLLRTAALLAAEGPRSGAQCSHAHQDFP